MTAIREITTSPTTPEQSFQHNLGGITLINEDTSEAYLIPQGMAIRLPSEFPIQLDAKAISMVTLQHLIAQAQEITLPPSIQINIAMTTSGECRIETTNFVASQILQYYAETHKGDFTITQRLRTPSVSIWSRPIAEDTVRVEHPSVVNYLHPDPTKRPTY